MFDILTYWFSILVMGTTISTIAGSLHDLRAMNEARARQRREVRLYLTGQNASYELISRIMKFVDYKLERTLAVQLDPTLISPTLQAELFVSQRSTFLCNIPIFSVAADVYPDVFAKICAALQKQAYEKGECVFMVGDLADRLHITAAGVFELDEAPMKNHPKRIQGEEAHWFSEIGLYAEFVLHTATLRARNIAEVFTLTGDDLLLCVHGSPSSTAMFYEYARDFLAMQESSHDKHHRQVEYAQLCCDKNTHYRSLRPDERKLFHNMDVRSHVQDLQHTDSPWDPWEHLAGLMGDVRSRSQDAGLDACEVGRQLQTLLPELHCAVGSYAVFEEFAARDQAESACVSTVALLCNRYDIYTEQQPEGDKLSLSQWEQLQALVKWSAPSEGEKFAVLVLLAIRALGKSRAVRQQASQGDPDRAVLYLMDSARTVVPSVECLEGRDPSMVDLLQETVLAQEVFKLAQMMQGENVPGNIAELRDFFMHRSTITFKFYIFYLLGFMSGISGGHGSRFMIARNAGGAISAIHMLKHLLDKSPSGIYWSYLISRARPMGLQHRTPEELALVRLACLSRVSDAPGLTTLWHSWQLCTSSERKLLVEHFLMDGIQERAFVLQFLPDCISSARANALLGLTVLLQVLVDLLSNLFPAVENMPVLRRRQIVTVDLSDLSAFAAAVRNRFIFRTCISRCKFHCTQTAILVQMADENWTRAHQQENDFSNLAYGLRDILVQQSFPDEPRSVEAIDTERV